MRGFLFLRLPQYVVGNSSVDGDQVEAADADNRVDDAAQPRHVSEDQGDEVETEESDTFRFLYKSFPKGRQLMHFL